MKWAAFVTTFDRRGSLARSMPSIMAACARVDAKVCIVNDGGYHGDAYEFKRSCCVIDLPQNRGLAAAWNIAFGYIMADPSIEAIAEWQDDTETLPETLEVLDAVLSRHPQYLVTPHDAAEHHAKPHSQIVDSPGPVVDGIRTRLRPSCRATMMAAKVDAWRRVLPIPSRGVGLPSKKIRDGNRGTGSGVDWAVVRDHPNALPVLCIPGLVRTFAWKKEDSTWDNQSIAGEDGPLHRDAIREWVNARS